MNKIKLLLLLVLIFSITSCKETNNGTYIVYKTENPPDYGIGEHGEDDNASDKLAEEFKGKKFQLEFHDQYIIMKEGKDREEMVLDKKTGDNDRTYYELVYTKGREKWELTLYNNLGTDLKNIDLFIKINVYKIDQIGRPERIKYANTSCQLQKYY